MGHSFKVLVLDREDGEVGAAVQELRRAGCEIVQASNGREALQMARDRGIDLVLLETAGDWKSRFLQEMPSRPAPGDPSVVLVGGASGDARNASVLTGAEPSSDADSSSARSTDLLAWVCMHHRQHELARGIRIVEQRFQDLATVMRDGVVIVDNDGIVCYMNGAAEELFQRSALSMTGFPLGLPLEGEDGREVRIPLAHNDRVDGVRAEMWVRPTQWAGRAASIVTLRDVSRCRTVEETLSNQASLLASAQRIGRMGSWCMDLRTRRLEWSDMTCELFGISPRRFTGSSTEFYELVLPEDRAVLNASHLRSLESEGLIESEYRIRRPDGEVRWMHERGSVERDGSGQPVRRLGMVMDITEHRRTEEERHQLLLREQAARARADAASHYYRSLFESAPGCYLVLTPGDYTIVAVSDAYLQATMTRREEISGRRLFDVFPDNPAESDADGVRNLRASLEAVERDRRSNVMAVQRYPIRRPEEQGGGFEERFWSPVNSPVFGPEGQLAFIIHRVEDVTEYLRLKQSQNLGTDAVITLETRAAQVEADIVLRSHELKRANEELDRSQSLLRMASRLSQVGGWTVDLPGYRMKWTDEVKLIHEVPLDHDPDKEEGFGYYAPEFRSAIDAAFRACVERGVPYDLELQIITRNGRRVWVRTIGEAVRNAAGDIVRVQGAFQDISQRRLADQTLRESEERFRLLSQATRDAIWDWNLKTNRLWWNESFESLFGSQTDETGFSLEAWTNRIHPEDYDRIAGDMRRAMNGEVEHWAGRRYRFLSRDGVYVHVIDRGSVIRDSSGQPVRIVGGMTDITERLELTEQLRRFQRLEAVGQLTGGVAHDFNNLLTVILGNAEMLGERNAGDERARVLSDMIISAARRGADLTQRLLAFARKQTLHPRAVNVNDLIAHMNELLRRTLGEQIDIAVLGGGDLWLARVDAGQLENALLNLAINARDAMEKGGLLTIEANNAILTAGDLGASEEAEPGEYVLISVSDTGTGISPEILDHVFDPFFTTKEPGRGTGLGLAMVYGFIKQSGGHVLIDSQPGQGTTVRMYLPRAAANERQPDGPDVPVPVPGGSECILLVEDDAQVRQYARRELEGLGYRVIEAENGRQALAILQERDDIDLLFTDLVMPGGIDGRQLAGAARNLRPRLGILFTSGYDAAAVVRPGRGRHDELLLSKPYGREDLATAIRSALATR